MERESWNWETDDCSSLGTMYELEMMQIRERIVEDSGCSLIGKGGKPHRQLECDEQVRECCLVSAQEGYCSHNPSREKKETEEVKDNQGLCKKLGSLPEGPLGH